MGGTGANSPKAEPYVCRRLKLIGRKPIRAGLGPDDPPERLTELADDLELLSELDVLSQEGLFQLRTTIQEVKQRWPEHDKPGGRVFRLAQGDGSVVRSGALTFSGELGAGSGGHTPRRPSLFECLSRRHLMSRSSSL